MRKKRNRRTRRNKATGDKGLEKKGKAEYGVLREKGEERGPYRQNEKG